MQVTKEVLAVLGTALKTEFMGGIVETQGADEYKKIAMEVASNRSGNSYPWLEEMPQIREWVGDRVVHELAKRGYAIENRHFELTVGVKKIAIEDDDIGIYKPIVKGFGQQTAMHPNKMSFGLLDRGHETYCHDGQYMFDTDHPWNEGTVSNYQTGALPAWYLLDTMQVVKPLIYQNRQPFQFTAVTDGSDSQVFKSGKYYYGVDGRNNAGFGFWFLAYKSNAELNADNFKAAILQMESWKNDQGDSLGVSPNLLVVPRVLKFKAKELLGNQRNSDGADNTFFNYMTWMDRPELSNDAPVL